jgi:hypothetical protein
MTARSSKAVLAATLAFAVVACDAIFGDTAQCKTDADCAGFGPGKVCGSGGTCIGKDAQPTQGDASTAPAPTGDADAPATGPLAKITVLPSTANIAPGLVQQFTVLGADESGRPVTPPGGFTWTVSGGGAIGSTGLFTAGTAGGGPFTVTAKSGSVSGTATVNVTSVTIQIGETQIRDNDDSGNADLLLAQVATLAKAATIKSLSFYIATAAGNLRLGIYDATGPDGGPGAKKAETAEMAAVAGWNAANVVTPVSLPAGNYWLAYAPSDSNLHFRLAGDGTGTLVYYKVPYGPMPASLSTTRTTQGDQWSFYATLSSP